MEMNMQWVLALAMGLLVGTVTNALGAEYKQAVHWSGIAAFIVTREVYRRLQSPKESS